MKKVEINRVIKPLRKKINLIIILILHSSLYAEVTIGFMGDVMLGRTVSDFLTQHTDYQKPWLELLPILKNNDFNIANLETTFTNSKNTASKTFTFKANPVHVQALQEANIGIVNLANNHILDFGKNGLNDTLTTLDKAHIKHTGAGINLKKAQEPAFFSNNGVTFAFIGITDNEPSWIADSNKAGINYMAIEGNSLSSIIPFIKELKTKVDNVIVSIHWGPNWNTRPPKEFRNFAHALINAGADVIHGHSAHIFQGIEIYKNKIILYSTGDFLDDYAIDEQYNNDRSFLFLISFTKKGPKSLRLVPTVIKNMQVIKAPYALARLMLKHIQDLSLELNTILSDNGTWHR